VKLSSITILAAALLVFSVSEAHSQISAPPINATPIYKNVFSLTGSLGFPYKQDDTWFWSVSAGYTRIIKIPFSASIGIAYDQVLSNPSGEPKTVINGFSLYSTINYSFLKVLTASTGLGKVIINDDNDKSELEFTDGNWLTGIALGVSLPDLPFTVRDSVTLGASWLWNINDEEPSLSLDIGFGWSF